MSWLIKLALGLVGIGGTGGAAIYLFGAEACLSAVRSVFDEIGKLLSRLSPQGWIGLIIAILLGISNIHWWGEARHWRKQSDRNGVLYAREHLAFGRTVLNYRTAAAEAAAADVANKNRVLSQQGAISERTANDYEARIADARATSDRLRAKLAAATHSGSPAGAAVSSVPSSAVGAAQDACDRLPDGAIVDPNLCATEQGIQLDELIKWALQQHAIDVNGPHQ